MSCAPGKHSFRPDNSGNPPLAQPNEYSLKELQRAFSKAVDEDEDILTQFSDAQE